MDDTLRMLFESFNPQNPQARNTAIHMAMCSNIINNIYDDEEDTADKSQEVTTMEEDDYPLVMGKEDKNMKLIVWSFIGAISCLIAFQLYKFIKWLI